MSTVSRVINDSKPVNKEKKEKVLKVIKENNFKPNTLARGLIMKKTNVIGVILPDISNNIFSETVKGIDEVLNKNGYNFILCNSGGIASQEIKYLELLIEKKIDGAILSGVEFTEAHKAFFKVNKLPTIMVGQQPEDLDIPSVDTDSFQAAYEAVKFLIALGHLRIACISGPLRDISAGLKRLKGYEKALADSGIAFTQRYCAQGCFTIDSGFAAMEKILQENAEPPTAVFAADDLMAIGAIDCIIDRGLSVPKDISVMGFDDSKIASAFRPALTTVHQDSFNTGSMAASMLLKKLKGETLENNTIFLPHKIISRNSTRAI